MTNPAKNSLTLPNLAKKLHFTLSNRTIPMKKYCVINPQSPFKHTQVMIHFICFGFDRVINKQIGWIIQSAIGYHQTFDKSPTV